MIVRVELYSVLDTVVISGDYVCCSVVFGFSVMWSVGTGVWYVCDVLYAVLYVRARSFAVCGGAVLKRYIKVCNMFSVVNVYLGHMKFCAVCINGRRHVCCSECNVVSNECNEPTSCLVQPIGTHGGEVM